MVGTQRKGFELEDFHFEAFRIGIELIQKLLTYNVRLICGCSWQIPIYRDVVRNEKTVFKERKEYRQTKSEKIRLVL